MQRYDNEIPAADKYRQKELDISLWPYSLSSYLWDAQSAVSVGAGNMGITTHRTRCEKSIQWPQTPWTLCLWPILLSFWWSKPPCNSGPFLLLWLLSSRRWTPWLSFTWIPDGHGNVWHWPKSWASAHGWDWSCTPLPFQESSGDLCGHWCPAV